ncbi:MAG: Phosphosulfolactate synthase [Solirubrobacterales bacterium]|jgi:phosphosulfolactate synthase|nr:Phosphosulfolactate synthase [Solirubrobacterales bacterium]
MIPRLHDLIPLPARSEKPRTTGLTHVLDAGLGPAEVESLLAVAGSHIDVVRLGWGSALVTDDLPEKLAVFARHDIPVMLGGTLTELAWHHGRIPQLCDWLEELGIGLLEVSSGTIAIPKAEKAQLVADLSARFTVYAEVGEKAADSIMAPYVWVEEIRQMLDAGATLVVCEGRAGGTAGLHRTTTETRTGLVEEIAHVFDPAQLVFEAPQDQQQRWFVQRFGADVNLGNVPPASVISLASLRLGLRSDTLEHFHA